LSTRNPNQLSPGNVFPERSPVVVDRIEAQPIRGAAGTRQGPRHASEQLIQRDGRLLANFGGGANPAEGVIEQKIADGRSPLAEPHGRASWGPSWSAPDAAVMDAFVQGNAVSDYAGTLSPPPFQPRDGANRNTLSPIGSLVLGESPGNIVNRAIAGQANGRVARRNAADITEAL
jgi:hypothetical protein